MSKSKNFPWYDPSQAIPRLKSNGFDKVVNYPSIHTWALENKNAAWIMATQALPYVSLKGLDETKVEKVKQEFFILLENEQTSDADDNASLSNEQPILTQSAVNIYVAHWTRLES